MSEEEEEQARTRPKRTPGGVPKPAPAGDHEYEERMVTSAEARLMLLGEQTNVSWGAGWAHARTVSNLVTCYVLR